MGNVIPIKKVTRAGKSRSLTAPAALEHLRKIGAATDGVVSAGSYAALAALLGWERVRTFQAVGRWVKNGQAVIETGDNGELRTIAALPPKTGIQGAKALSRGKGRSRKPVNASPVPGVNADAENAVNAKVETAFETGVENPPTASVNVVQNPPSKSQGYAMSFFRKAEAKPRALAADVTTEIHHPDTSENRSPVTTGDHLPERAVERPVWRSSGGELEESGFDAVDAFRKATPPEKLMILIAAGLSGTAAYASVSGLVVLVPGAPTFAMVLGYLIESAKFVGAGVVSAGWGAYSWVTKSLFALLLIVAALINASGMYGYLIANHAGPAATRAAAFTESDAGDAAKLEAAQANLADVDRRIAVVDGASKGAAERGKGKTATAAIDREKGNRAALSSERASLVQQIAGLRAGRGTAAAHHEADEAAALPVRYSAMLFEDMGLLRPGTDPEKLWRWIAFMVLLTADPLALVAMAMINSRHRRA